MSTRLRWATYYMYLHAGSTDGVRRFGCVGRATCLR